LGHGFVGEAKTIPHEADSEVSKDITRGNRIRRNLIDMALVSGSAMYVHRVIILLYQIPPTLICG
jgi:hypothetical protein